VCRERKRSHCGKKETGKGIDEVREHATRDNEWKDKTGSRRERKYPGKEKEKRGVVVSCET